MRVTLWFATACLGIVGCSRSSPDPSSAVASPHANAAAAFHDRAGTPMSFPPQPAFESPQVSEPTTAPGTSPEVNENGERGFVLNAWRKEHDRLLGVGWERLAQGHWAEAYEAFSEAKQLRPADWLNSLTQRLRIQISRETEAELVAYDIQKVLDAGQAEVARQLAVEALRGFGFLQTGHLLASLQRQADALLMIGADAEQRRVYSQRWQQEYERASAERDLRATWLALDQLVTWTDDPRWQPLYRTTTAQWQRYESLRRLAFTIRHNPERLDEVIPLLEEAATIWPNPLVLAELNEARMAHRRHSDDRLAVADSIIQAEVLPPEWGARLADELALQFQRRFDVMDRAEFQRRLEQIPNIDIDGWLNDAVRHQLSLAFPQLRYLVWSVVTPWAGATLKVQLLDLKTGLLVQRGQVSAPTGVALLEQIPGLARSMSLTENLLVNDPLMDEAREEPMGQVSQTDVPPLLERLGEIRRSRADLPRARPSWPAWGDLTPENFIRRLEQWPPTVSGLSSDEEFAARDAQTADWRRRAARVAVELGDNYLSRGQYISAWHQFDVALTLWPNFRSIRERWDFTRYFVPDPRESLPRPERVIIVPFADSTEGRPVAAPMGRRVAAFLGGYLMPQWDVVDPAEWSHWMNQLGLSISDLLTDPLRRACLAEALQARYYVFGAIIRSNPIDVRVYLMDSETGNLVGGARISGRDAFEIKNRLADLAWLLRLSPEERQLVERSNPRWAWLALEIEQARERDRDMNRVLELAARGLKQRPYSVEMRQTWWNSRFVRDSARLELRRLTDQEDLEKVSERTRQIQIDVARRSEESRKQVGARSGESQPLSGWDRPTRERVANECRRRAAQATEMGRPLSALALLEAAGALQPDNTQLYEEWAQVRALWEKQLQGDLAEARKIVSPGQPRRDPIKVREQAVRTENKPSEELPAAVLPRVRPSSPARRVDDWRNRARLAATEGRYADALRAAGRAQSLQPSADWDQKRLQWLRAWNKAETKRTTAEPSESKVEGEDFTVFFQTLDSQVEQRRRRLQALLDQGEEWLRQNRWGDAEDAFRKADALQLTARGAKGRREARRQQRQQAESAAANASREQQEQQRMEEFRQRRQQADLARAGEQYDRAIELYEEALRRNPGEVSVWSAWAQTHRLRWRQRVKSYGEALARLDALASEVWLSSARHHVGLGKWLAAAVNIDMAHLVTPNNPEIETLATEIHARLPDDEKARYQQKRRSYDDAVRRGFRQLLAQNFEEAIADFRQAQVHLPDDPAAREFVEKAQQRRAAPEKRPWHQPASEFPRNIVIAVSASLQRMRQCLAENRLADARDAHEAALRASRSRPHPDALAARDELETALQRASTEAAQSRLREQQQADRRAALAAALATHQQEIAEKMTLEMERLSRDDPVLHILIVQQKLRRGEDFPEESPIR